MSVVIILVVYAVMGILTAKLVANYTLTKMYTAHLQNIVKNRASFNTEVWDETAEETALRCAKEEFEDTDAAIFWTGVAGWFWPFTIVFFACLWTIQFLKWSLGGFDFISSKAEREVKKVLSEKERKKLIKQQEIELEVERKRLLQLARRLDIETKGLETEIGD